MADPPKKARAPRAAKTTATTKKKATTRSATGKTGRRKTAARTSKKISRGTTAPRDRDSEASVERSLPPPGIPSHERQRMVAEAAYYKALNRGFHGGNPERDWAEAEAEIRAMLERSVAAAESSN
jgi:hypothetical protein